jgi:hypothetical protein
MKRNVRDVSSVSLPDGEQWKPVVAFLTLLRSRKRHPSARATLDRLEWAIGTLARSGGSVTATAVGSLCVDAWGGPRPQSIANDKDGYAELIRIAKSAQTAPRKAGPRAVREGDLISRIADPMIRAEVRILIAEAVAWRGQVGTLTRGIRRMQALGPITSQMAIERVDALEDLSARIESRARPVGLRFTDEERAAARSFLGSLHNEGFTVDQRTSDLLSRTGRRVAKGGLVTALKKIADQGGEASEQQDARDV